jgi:excisionase family DNA binding protein
MTKAEVAAYLRCSHDTVERRIKDGTLLPHYVSPTTRRPLFDADEIDQTMRRDGVA